MVWLSWVWERHRWRLGSADMEGQSCSVLCSLATDAWMVFQLCSLFSSWCMLPVSWLFLRAVLLLGSESLFLRQLCVCVSMTLINSLGFLHPDVKVFSSLCLEGF